MAPRQFWQPAHWLCGGDNPVNTSPESTSAPGDLLPGRWFGAVSLSLIAAFCHIAGQLALARLWLIPSDGILYFVPPFALAACLTGLVGELLNDPPGFDRTALPAIETAAGFQIDHGLQPLVALEREAGAQAWRFRFNGFPDIGSRGCLLHHQLTLEPLRRHFRTKRFEGPFSQCLVNL